MDISDRIARILGFQQIQLVEKDAMIEQLQAKINELEKQRDLMLKEGRYELHCCVEEKGKLTSLVLAGLEFDLSEIR